MTIPTIIVSTDEPIVEIGMRAFFEGDPEFHLHSVVRTHQDTLHAMGAARPAVVVYGLGAEADLDSIRDLQNASPGTAIVMWTRGVSTEFAHQAVTMGVRGFLSTGSSIERFKECVLVAARGELWMEQSLTMSLLNSRPVRLSKRQGQLVQLLVQGLKNKEIATELGISEGTVKAYLTTLFEKVGARDRFELALFGLKTVGLGTAGIQGTGSRRARNAESDARFDASVDIVSTPLKSMVARERLAEGLFSPRRGDA